MPYEYAYCSHCYEEHYVGPKGINTFMKCKRCGQFNGVKSYDGPPGIAFCTHCYKEHKSHNYPSTFSKCTGCSQFNGLKWKKSGEQIYSATCSKCHAFYRSHNTNGPFSKCLSCGQFNGLRFK